MNHHLPRRGRAGTTAARPGTYRLGRGARALAGATLAVVAGGLVAACGIPVDSSPHALPSNAIPFGLLNKTSSTTSSTSTTTPTSVTVKVFFLDPAGHLVAVERNVAAHPPGGELEAVLNALVQGPTSIEAGAGLRSAVPPTTRVLHTSEAGGVATVDLSSVFGQLIGPPQIQAVAQVVYTATSLPGITGVAFELGGQSVDVPVASGAQVPVATAAQFATLAHPDPTTTAP